MKKFGAFILALATIFTLGVNQHAIAKSTKSASASSSDTIEVKGYTRKDGTVVKGYTRKKSNKSADATKETKETKEVSKTEAAPAASTEVTKTDTKESTKTHHKKSK